MNNALRSELLAQTKKAQQLGFKGSIMDVLSNPMVLQEFTQQQNRSRVEVASTPKQQQQGLSGVPANQMPEAMVFPNVKPNTSFNTKDMLASINIKKYDNQGHLVKSYDNVPPGITNLPMGPQGGTVIETPANVAQSGGRRKYQSSTPTDYFEQKPLTSSDFKFTTDRTRGNARFFSDPVTGEPFPLVNLPEAEVAAQRTPYNQLSNQSLLAGVSQAKSWFEAGNKEMGYKVLKEREEDLKIASNINEVTGIPAMGRTADRVQNNPADLFTFEGGLDALSFIPSGILASRGTKALARQASPLVKNTGKFLTRQTPKQLPGSGNTFQQSVPQNIQGSFRNKEGEILIEGKPLESLLRKGKATPITEHEFQKLEFLSGKPAKKLDIELGGYSQADQEKAFEEGTEFATKWAYDPAKLESIRKEKKRLRDLIITSSDIDEINRYAQQLDKISQPDAFDQRFKDKVSDIFSMSGKAEPSNSSTYFSKNKDYLINVDPNDPIFKTLPIADQQYVLDNYRNIGGARTATSTITLRKSPRSKEFIKVENKKPFDIKNPNTWLGKAYNEPTLYELNYSVMQDPEIIRGVAAHEVGHDLQQYKNWIDRVVKYDSNYNYYTGHEDNPLAKRIKSALVDPVKPKGEGLKYETWLSSFGEVHSEIMKAREKFANTYVKRGDFSSLDEATAYIRSQSDSDDFIDQLIEFGDLKKHFKPGTTQEEKRFIVKIAPALVPTVLGTGAAAAVAGSEPKQIIPPDFKYGGPIRYQNGGATDPPSKKLPPIYVDPADQKGQASYQAYQDSLQLYNQYVDLYKEGLRVSKDQVARRYNIQQHPNNPNLFHLVGTTQGKYTNPLYSNFVNPNILPIAGWNYADPSNAAISSFLAEYKEPTQPIELKRPQIEINKLQSKGVGNTQLPERGLIEIPLPSVAQKRFPDRPYYTTDSKGNKIIAGVEVWDEKRKSWKRSMFDPQPKMKDLGKVKFQNGGLPGEFLYKSQSAAAPLAYNSPTANGYLLPDPNRPELMNTGATEYKMGVDDVTIPTVVNGQYFSPETAYQRYKLTGEKFKPTADPSAYSKFYDEINRLGIMKNQGGGPTNPPKEQSYLSDLYNTGKKYLNPFVSEISEEAQAFIADKWPSIKNFGIESAKDLTGAAFDTIVSPPKVDEETGKKAKPSFYDNWVYAPIRNMSTSVLPSNIVALKQSMEGIETPLENSFFPSSELQDIYSLVKRAKADGRDYVTYTDYNPVGNVMEQKSVSGYLGNQEKVRTTLGQFTFEEDPETGVITIKDTYDFNPSTLDAHNVSKFTKEELSKKKPSELLDLGYNYYINQGKNEATAMYLATRYWVAPYHAKGNPPVNITLNPEDYKDVEADRPNQTTTPNVGTNEFRSGGKKAKYKPPKMY